MTRMGFGRARRGRYNPNILSFPKDYKYPYIGFARQSPKAVLYHHEVVWCEMDWSETPRIGQKILQCVQPAQKLNLEEWTSKPGSWHSDPRIMFSPLGEPLMVVGTNGKANCMGQFVIDLRAVIPGLSTKMKLDHVPIRYQTLIELPRPDYNEVEKNWFLMWDEANIGHVQHESEHRSISALDAPPEKQVNIATPGISKCVSALKHPMKKEKGQANDVHQGTNSLRVTLCDFPCIPTIHNTVIIELLHLKYKNVYELFYRRYAIIMNATAPFNIIGRTGNLMYAGTDENVMLYSVSITWDHDHYREHDDWNEEVHGGHKISTLPDVSSENEEEMVTSDENISSVSKRGIPAKRHVRGTLDSKSRANLQRRPTTAGEIEALVGNEGTTSVSAPAHINTTASVLMTSTQLPVATTQAHSESTASSRQSESPPWSQSADDGLATVSGATSTPEHAQNSLVNKYYHGWLDDMIMIGIGINDRESGVLHVRARDILECIHVCE
ncbi:hypothetical protein LIPSTDRAFT_112898 [Lipomyces starkeyi NRRL Y-11557]|uniref:Uncharacterized protein n=1 Tax=Lipomyces starkeyi NRRL Y-11557 TaxID=675824 RepID=A0A1E3PZ55_LIPST|nr:hypothetical protein LIPSTDRAFT_112898 [Lipomyces starkeyi NRRL Y-11557]